MDMMETALTGVMDDEMIEELSKSAQRFRGKLVKIVIQEVNDQERKLRGRRGE
jgi:hypothetical protein